MNDVELVALCDANAERAKQFADTFDAQPFTDFDELLQRDDIDAVSICVPDREHTGPAVAAAKAGKAILLEKPLAHDTAHAREIVDAVELSGVRFMVGHILRFDTRYVKVFEASRPSSSAVTSRQSQTQQHPRECTARWRCCIDPLLHGRSRC